MTPTASRHEGRRVRGRRSGERGQDKLRADANTTASIRAPRPEHRLAGLPATAADRGLLRLPVHPGRRPVQGRRQDTVIGLRELNLAGIPKNNWINDHFKLHARLRRGRGQGHRDHQDRRRRSSSSPTCRRRASSASTSSGSTTASRPSSTRSSAVRRRSSTTPTTSGEKSTSYKGNSGVSLDNPVNRAAYAVTFSEPQILYSGAIGEGSRILYNRTPKERVEAVAPWLTIDGDPYPAVVDGRIQWIVDAYTTTNGYPYASRTTLGTPPPTR